MVGAGAICGFVLRFLAVLDSSTGVEDVADMITNEQVLGRVLSTLFLYRVNSALLSNYSAYTHAEDDCGIFGA